MNKLTGLCLFMAFCVFTAGAQKKTGYFGRNFFIGYEHSIRPFGNAGVSLTSQNIGFGKIKIEKLRTKNRVLGFSFESMKYQIMDGLHPDFPLKTNPPRYLTSRIYTTYFRKYYRARGMAPIGLYVGLNVSFMANSIDYTQNGWNGFDFGDIYNGFEMGKAFPLYGNRLFANVSAGLNISLTGIIDGDPIGSSESYNYDNTQSHYDMNGDLFLMNFLKANIGISYAIF